MTLRATLAIGLALLLPTPEATAQTAVVDQGTFEISIRGSEIGAENFTIRRSGSGQNAATVAQGRVVLDTGEQIRTVIEVRGRELRPAAYQIEVSGDDRQSIRGRAAGSRFRATVVSGAGEQMREYITDARAVILDNGMAHHHYFVAVGLDDSGSLPVIVPRQSRQVTARVQDHGSETIRIGGREVTARRLSIDLTGLDDRSVWVDSRNRVLQLRIPQQDLVAVRTELP